MSRFLYGQDLTDPSNHNQKRLGVWLRKTSNKDIIGLFNKSKCKRFYETIQYIIVKEYQEGHNLVLLEVWCK